MSRALRIAWSPAICIRDAYASRGDTEGVVASTVLCREIAAQCAENAPALLRQVTGIGQRYAEKLWKEDVQSIVQLCEKTAREIEHVLGRNPPFGTKVLASARGFPVYQLEMTMEWVDETSVIFTIRITCGRSKVNADAKVRGIAFTVVAYTSDGLLLKFEVFELSSESAYYETQVGLCNPIPGTTAILEVAPERYEIVGCGQRLELSISPQSSDNTCADLPTVGSKDIKVEYGSGIDHPSSDLLNGLIVDESDEIANLLLFEDLVDCDIGCETPGNK
ncbi:hypothetical protein COEREDRAFT_88382 [Coemansia reversa NRRL 1564]|uniref:SEC63 domain-containing protein n=1 Tax=Coemansia reversa (strain ATCC 12441 / NRRL 1564) TaxID=763665 RepID=A0A2G5B785_COERN|nr:hypothetical protein COEREDRAFT_88382 [Coemansia reversa NRRL 1564]|eukprot:PIA14861.1 hypothetical protein COEREDRAFT_88382 [Coemansia reversa NRRL 1564]